MSTAKKKADKPSKTTNAANLLKNLSASKKVKTKEPAKKSSRPLMELNPFEQEALKRFAESQVLFKDVEARMDSTKEAVNRFALSKWTEILWASKSRPVTHGMQVVDEGGNTDITANFIVTEKPKFNVPEKKEGETLEDAFTRTFEELLVATGMKEDEAETAAENIIDEMDLDDRAHLDFFRWAVGRYEGEGANKEFKPASDEDQALAGKMIDVLRENLTEDEFDKILEFKPNISLRKGFFERICGYLNSKEQLQAIVEGVIHPVHYPHQIKLCADEKGQRDRKHATAKEILGVT